MTERARYQKANPYVQRFRMIIVSKAQKRAFVPPTEQEVAAARQAYQASGGLITRLKEEVVPLNLRVHTKYD